MSVIHVISVSGGKDSTATLLIALDRFPRERVLPIFCDTGNEHAQTYEYLRDIETILGLHITRLKADFTDDVARKRMFIARDQRTRRDSKGRRVRWSNKAKRRALAVLFPTGNPFLDLCMLKGRFPSRKAQFCTEELKRNMAVEFQLGLVEQGHRVVSWQGVRRDESAARANVLDFERIGPRMYVHRPIAGWTALQVFAHCTAAGVPHNPLYRQGMTRVGCMPCINVRKDELREISQRFPDEIDRIEEWERLVSAASKHGFSTMLSDGHEAQDRRQVFADLNIRARVEWSKTSRGGRQSDLFADVPSPACSSSYGLCEGA